MPVRKRGLDVSVFNLAGTDLLADLKSATLTLDSQTDEARGIADKSAFPWPISDAWSIQGEIFVNSSAAVATMWSNNNVVSITFNTGGNTYSGTAVLKNVSHEVNETNLQGQKVTLEGQGDLNFS